MKTGWVLAGLWLVAGCAGAADGRYEALPLAGAEGGKGGSRAFILDTQDGHVWIWSENELMTAADGRRRYGSGFIYQGKLHPGSRPGEMIEQQGK